MILTGCQHSAVWKPQLPATTSKQGKILRRPIFLLTSLAPHILSLSFSCCGYREINQNSSWWLHVIRWYPWVFLLSSILFFQCFPWRLFQCFPWRLVTATTSSPNPSLLPVLWPRWAAHETSELTSKQEPRGTLHLNITIPASLEVLPDLYLPTIPPKKTYIKYQNVVSEWIESRRI